LAARTLLVTFTTCFVACGGSSGQEPTTTTVPAAVPTTSPPPPPPPPPTAPPPTTPPPPPAPPPTLPDQPPQQLNKNELQQLVAPVALYPDVVLASLLPATTNPDQLHDAAQYVGDAQQVPDVPQDRGWDGSVVGLLQFPDVLRWLDANPAWTDEMGQAVTYQQGDVLQAIQDYRKLAQNAGNLKSNQYQTVRYVQDQDIRIEPARPDVVYVPSYDPELAVQPQPVPAPGVNPWIVFGAGAAVGALGAWALYSIFDDDDHDHYHGGGYYGGRRGIRRYDNYYYARGRRPRPVEWTPRPRPYRQQAGWQRPHRLEHRAPVGRPVRSAPLRAPSAQGTGAAPRPGEVKREMRQERQQQKQENRQERQQQKQDNRQQRQQQKQENRQERQQQKQGNRQERQMQRGQRQEQQREQRQQKQENRQDQRQQRQEIHQGMRKELQQQRQQRQDQRQQRQEIHQGMRKELQQQRQENRQERRQQNQGEQNKKKKKQQQ
jgi:hypothetical protein